MIGFSLGLVDDLWSDWYYVDLLLMLDDLDVLSLIWLGFDLLFFFLILISRFVFLNLDVVVLVQNILRYQFM